MAKPKKSRVLRNVAKHVAARKKRKPRMRRNAALVGNPPDDGLFERYVEPVVAGAAGFALTQVVGRIAYKIGCKKSETVGKHCGPLASVAAAAGLSFAANKIEGLEKYAAPVTIGAGIAALKGLLQTYMPVWGWVLNDYHLGDPMPENAKAKMIAAQQNGAPQALPEPTEADDDFGAIAEIGDDDDFGSLGGGW